MGLNKELFVLPEKWCVKVTDDIIEELIELRKSINRPHPEGIKKYKYFIANSSIHHKFNYAGDARPMYIEITTEQFKQHFMKDKEIIGYKLIKPEYKEAALAIVSDYPTDFLENISNIRTKSRGNNAGTDMYKRFKKAGVLDLWFEPVYKEDKPKLPEIDGYKGVFSGDYIIYGCAKLSIKWFTSTENRHIRTMQLNSGVYITKEQMNQIRKVIEYNK